VSIFQIVQFQVNEINFNEQFSNCFSIQHYVTGELPHPPPKKKEKERPSASR
jgi:hypothetical protein